ncbi:hypothetical protein B4U79_00255 [Dinothrombium tinctorium]|uniref:Uncharacterized protein n=1 Tax=Dinothrombium tinctorium TaxID=1965070 RepID=A0A443R1D7_9ACAR|nr:hypothetical protein B4U79_00255 [Dinothrombium tinctorium]
MLLGLIIAYHALEVQVISFIVCFILYFPLKSHKRLYNLFGIFISLIIYENLLNSMVSK